MAKNQTYRVFPHVVVLLIAGMLALSAFAPTECSAQPKREVRGIWLTTLLGLDWPPASERGNPHMQKASLKRIIDNIAEMNLNTVFFQVRSRGNAFYRSQYEPWAAELTGTLGRDPGWDPLQYAIELCHERGMEIHAWINVCKVWQGGGAPPLVKPGHVARQHPEWVEIYKDEYWLDPGIPEARGYVAQVISGLVRDYDLDGIHLDYVRYPELDFNDANTYKRYGNGTNREEWHRQNMNTLVKLIYDRTTAMKPWMKVGSAPIGIYKSLPTARGWEGYVRLGQDSRRWLRDGYQDYVVPQIYWGLRNRGSGIDYQALVHDWRANSSGKHVYVGTAAYRPNVASWLFEHIDVCRSEYADGQVYFRYAFLQNGQLFHGRYQNKAIPPAMIWRDAEPPAPPVNVRIQPEPNGMLVEWEPGNAQDAPRRYVLYRSFDGSVDINNPANILTVLPGGTTRYTDAHGNMAAAYLVTALDAMNNESTPGSAFSPVAATEPEPVPMRYVDSGAALANPVEYNDEIFLIGYRISETQKVQLKLLDEDGKELYVLVDTWQRPGSYVIGVERNRMPGIVAQYTLTAGDVHLTRNVLQ